MFTCALLQLLHTRSDHRPVVLTDAHKPAGDNDTSGHLSRSVSALCTATLSGTHCDFLFLLGTSSLIFCSPTKMRWDSLKSLRRMGEQMSSSFLTMWTSGEPAELGPEQKHHTLRRIHFIIPRSHINTVCPERI